MLYNQCQVQAIQHAIKDLNLSHYTTVEAASGVSAAVSGYSRMITAWCRLGAEVLQAAATAVTPADAPLHILAPWLSTLPWLADSRWRKLRTSAPTEVWITLCRTLSRQSAISKKCFLNVMGICRADDLILVAKLNARLINHRTHRMQVLEAAGCAGTTLSATAGVSQLAARCLT